jgi:putative acetyltransferase
MRIRTYRSSDAAALARIFHDAVQVGSAAHYTQARRDDWSVSCPTAAGYRARLLGLTTFVAVDAVPVGFFSVRDEDGYIDLAFVTPGLIGTGVAFAIYQRVLGHFKDLKLTHATVEASAQSHIFFTRQGWRVTGRMPRGEGDALINNWLMDKDLTEDDAGLHD